MRIATALLSFLVLASSGFAEMNTQPQPSVAYRDSSGNQWKRWIITEDEGDLGTLLIVAELPEGSGHHEEVLFRKRFGKAHSADLFNSKLYYQSLSDLHGVPRRPQLVADPKTPPLPIWTLKQNYWTAKDEADYANWVSTTVTTGFLDGANFLVDCADFSITLRWVYAHDHGLPAANSLSSGTLFGQWSGRTEWNALPTDPNWRNDQRFRAALTYLLNSAYTHTIVSDLYPVELSANYITPGSIDLVVYSNTTGHTQVVNYVGQDPDEDSFIEVLYGNEPRASTVYESPDWIVNGAQGTGGFMRWRWPVVDAQGNWHLTAATQMPGYSLEQYSYPTLSDDDFELMVFQKLGFVLSPVQQALVAGHEFLSNFKLRMSATSLGQFYCASQTNPTPNVGLCDDYSTNSRDVRFKTSQQKLLAASALIPTNADDLDEWNYFLDTLGQTLIGSGYSTTAADFALNRNNAMAAIDPDATHAFYTRWGLDGTQTDSWFQSFASLWANAWYVRDRMVDDSQVFCFRNGSTTSSCDRTSSAVKTLDTTTLDAGLRNSKVQMKALIPKVSSGVVDFTNSYLTSVPEFDMLCGSNMCTVEDFLFGAQPYTDRMSSLPWDTLQKRFGM